MFSSDDVGPDGYYIGFPDAFNGHTKPERTENSVLYRNEGGNKFVDVSAEMGIEKSALVCVTWASIDGNNDGWMDLYVISMQGPDG